MEMNGGWREVLAADVAAAAATNNASTLTCDGWREAVVGPRHETPARRHYMKLGHHTRPSLCSFLRLVALLALIGGVAGCASTQPPPATDISGMWQGTWVNMTVAGGGSGQIEMTVTQTGAKYVGHILMTGLDNHPTGPTLGFVTGNEV